MDTKTTAATPTPTPPGHVTRIARRRAKNGREAEYETLVREMFQYMRSHRGFLGAELIPPPEPGGEYQVVVNFASEADLAVLAHQQDTAEPLSQQELRHTLWSQAHQT